MAVEIAACTFTVSGQASLQEDLSLFVPDGTVQVGSAGFGALTFTLDNGSGDNQGNQMYAARLTVAAGGGVSLNLSDGTLKNFRGQSIAFSAVKLALVAVVDPDGVKKVWVGPQGVANAAPLWFKGTGSDAADGVDRGLLQTNLKAGWAVSAPGSQVLRIANPGGSAVDVDVVLVGVQ